MVRSILVTGASSGIGRATAALLAAGGDRVFAASRSLEPLQALAGQDSAGCVVPLPMDVQDSESVDRAMAELARLQEGRGLDAIVHCAGYAQPGPLEILTDQALRSQFETNVFGLLRVTRAALPAMRARGSGRIVVMGSIAGRFSTPNLGAYQASKHALEAISDTLRLELAPFGIQVVLVEAGLVRTGLDERALEEQKPFAEIPSPYQAFLAHTPQLMAASRRLACEPEEVARVVLRILERDRPANRYRVPAHAGLAIWMHRLLPTPLYDALVRRLFGYPTRVAIPGQAGTGQEQGG